MTKNYCQIHHLYYSGNECPMCMSERIESLEKRFVEKEHDVETKKKQSNKEATQESLNKLMAKFNNR